MLGRQFRRFRAPALRLRAIDQGIARQNSAHIGRQRLGNGVLRRLFDAEDLLKAQTIVDVGLQNADQSAPAMALLRRSAQRWPVDSHLIFQTTNQHFLERGDPAIPKLMAIEDGVDQAGSISRPADRDAAILAEAELRLMATGACERVGANDELAQEKDLPAELPFQERWRI